jgi:DNA-directed RNA polymerase subunit F
MIGKEVIKSEPMPSSKVKEIIEDFADTNELNYQQNLTLNHLARFKRYSAEDAEEIYEKLQEEFGLRDKVAAHIVDMVPLDLAVRLREGRILKVILMRLFGTPPRWSLQTRQMICSSLLS